MGTDPIQERPDLGDAREHEGGAAAELLLEMNGPATAGHRYGQQAAVHRQGQGPLERAEGDDELAAGMIALDDQGAAMDIGTGT